MSGSGNITVKGRIESAKKRMVCDLIVSFLVSMEIVVFAMAAGAACYHQYIVQSQRTSREQIIIRERIKETGAAGCRPERKR